jgi:hypothetical protein
MGRLIGAPARLFQSGRVVSEHSLSLVRYGSVTSQLSRALSARSAYVAPFILLFDFVSSMYCRRRKGRGGALGLYVIPEPRSEASEDVAAVT